MQLIEHLTNGRPSTGGRPFRFSIPAIITPILLLLALWLPAVLSSHSSIVAGTRHWWLGDDAMISMRYAHNLARGEGLVWNPGERVEGYSNFLWTLYMALVHLFPLPASKTSLVLLLTNVAIAAGCLLVMARILRLLGGNTLALWGALAGFALNRDLLFWTGSGFETMLQTLFLLICLCLVIRDCTAQTPRLSTYLWIATLSLVRSDAAVLSALLYGFSLLLHRKRMRVLQLSAVSLVVPLAHELFRVLYYSDILPNTAYLKVMNWNGKLRAGWDYLLTFARDYGFLVTIALVGAAFSKHAARRALGLLIVLYSVYVVYVGGDAFQEYRFFIPVVPLLLLLGFLGLEELLADWKPRLALGAVCVLAAPLVFPGYASLLKPSNRDAGNIAIGLMLKENTGPSARVADSYAGTVFYFSERPGIDLLGKSDRRIARMSAVSGTRPGHNKFDYDYSLGILKPDYVVAMFRLPVQEADMRRKAGGDLPFIGQLYFNPLFREHCLPHPVEAPAWRTIFVCDWSPEFGRAGQPWKLNPE